MDTQTKKLYEALFLIDSAEAASDWDGICEYIKKVLDKSGAEIVSLRKWDDRPLAYEINRKKRGVYILVYFNAPGDGIGVIERDVQLSERVMRVLILKGDHLTEDDLNKDTPLLAAEKAAEVAAAAAEVAAAAKVARVEAAAAEAAAVAVEAKEEVVEEAKEDTAETADGTETD